MSLWIAASSAAAIKLLPRKLRFRLGLFLVRIWRLCELRRLMRPLPVLAKRFAAPLLVLIFGMSLSYVDALHPRTKQKNYENSW